jgi:Flp pilus assembly protein TadG
MGPAGGRRDDQGTVLLLTIGMSVVLLLLVAVVVDVSKVILVKRALASAADGAAVAAAQRADLAAIRSDPGALDRRVPLDPVAVADVVASFEADARGEQPGLELAAEVDPADPTLAVVRGSRTVRLVEVQAEARARSPIAP